MILIHDPVGPFDVSHAAFAEHQRFLDSYLLVGVLPHDGAVLAGHFPVTGSGRAVGAPAVQVIALHTAIKKQLPPVEHVIKHIGQLPGFKFAYIDLRNYIVVEVARLSKNLGLQVKKELLIGGMESKLWRE